MDVVQEFTSQVNDNVEKVIIGKRSAIELVMVALRGRKKSRPN